MLRVDRRHLPDGRAGREHFDQRKAQAPHLVLHGAPDRACRLRNLLVVSQAHAFDVDRRLQRCQQFAHVQRIAFIQRIAAVRSRRALLTEQRGRRVLPAGHAVNGVVDENHGDVFAAIGGVQNFRRTDCRQVAVALVADDDALRPAAPTAGGDRGCAPVRGLHVAYIEVVVRKYGAAHRADEDGPVLDAELIDGPRQHLVDRPVAASGAIVGLVLQFFLALVGLVEHPGLGVQHFIL